MSAVDILNFAVQYTLYSGWIISSLGVVGNIINILVFTQLKLFQDNRSALYITVETLSNLLFQASTISVTILTSIYGNDATGRSVVWCKSRFILAQIIVLTTYYMTCCAAVDQFFSTNHHPHLRQLCTLKLARCVTVTLICFWIAHSIVFGMFFDIQPSVGCVISNHIFLQYATFFVYPVLSGLLPIITSCIFSLLAYQNVRRIVRRQIPIVRRRRDRQMTAMVLIRVVFFVCLALPYSFFRIYTTSFPIPRSQSMDFAIRQLIQSVFLSFFSFNYAVTFYIFMISSSRFRRQVKYVLVRKCWKRWKQWCCRENNQIAPENIEIDDANIELQEEL